jgi:hypothetical protein
VRPYLRLRRRRSQRSVRAMKFAWPVVVVVCLAAGAYLLVGNQPSPDVVAGTMPSRLGRSGPSPDLGSTPAKPKAKQSGSGLSIRQIESYMGVESAQDFVIVFDGPVPDDRVSYVEDIRNIDAPAVAYTTQEWTPENPTALLTCGASHFGFNPPVVVGQVDVLMPGDWFRAPPDTAKIIWKHDPKGTGGKTPLCGPHDGYVQFAIWGPASHDPGDIRVYFDGRTRLVIEIRPGPGCSPAKAANQCCRQASGRP